MFRVFNIVLASLSIVLFISGCADSDGPKPGDTVLGNPQRPGGGDGIFINPEDSVGNNGTLAFEGDGLKDRDPSFNSFNGDGMGGSQNVLDSIYFGFDESSVPASERGKLDSAAEYLRNNPGTSIIAEGHTDSVGTSEYNNGLSDRRANSVKTYMEQLGIDGNRIEVLSLGEIEADQSATKGSESSRYDRRVDLISVQ
ncbi:MAG: OmpA family protein [Verrucomicrobiota bacterium]